MTDKKRQGQGGAIQRPLCPKCKEYLQVCYKRKLIDGKRVLVPVGMVCDSDKCDHIEKSKPEDQEQ